MNKSWFTRFGAGLLASACLLAGCGPQPVSTIATVQLETASREEMTQAAKILEARFETLKPSSSSSFMTIVREHEIVFEFRGEAPPDQAIRDYASQGVLRIYAAESPLNWLVTDRDIESVNARQGDDGALLDLAVNERAGERLHNYTSRSVGKLLVTSWNGKEQSRARVGGVFSRRFQSTGMDRETALRMKAMLESGRLPVALREVKIEHPSTAG